MGGARATAMLLGGLLAGCGGGDDPTGPPPGGTPRIGIASGQIEFVGVSGGGNPQPRTAAISNAGTGALTALAIGTISYGPGASGWLNATLSATSAPSTLTLAPSVAGIPPGSYTATVPVTAAGAANTPQTVSVSLLLLEQPGGSTTLAAGQSAAFLDSPAFATNLSASAGVEYLIAVVNTAPGASITEDFTLAAAPLNPPTAAAPAVSTAEEARRGVSGPAYRLSRGDRARLAGLHRLTENHVHMLHRHRELYARRRATGPARPEPGFRPAQTASAPVSDVIGTVNRIYVQNDVEGGCGDVDSVGARTVAVGQHVIVLADTNLTAWPQIHRPDSAYYQIFADEFDQITWPHNLAYAGDPLLLDGDLSGQGKVTALITPVLNTLGGGTVAFVNPCDFFPKVDTGPVEDRNFSNFTEIFYSLTASANLPVGLWGKLLRSTAAHELKHIAAVASRIQSNSPSLEEVWLEEGLAQVSSEVWMRNFNQAAWRGNADFLQTVACEINLGPAAPCNLDNTRPLTLVSSHFPFLWNYLRSDAASPVPGLGSNTASNYGAGWSLARWATDAYAVNEADFVRGLIGEPQLVGLANLSTRTGEPIPAMLAYWSIATGIAGPRPAAAADVRAAFPSFNLADIFSVGQTSLTCDGVPCGLFTDDGQPPYPVQPEIVTANGFTHTVTAVPGTGASYFRFTAPAAGSHVFRLLSGSVGPVPPASALRVVILRVS